MRLDEYKIRQFVKAHWFVVLLGLISTLGTLAVIGTFFFENYRALLSELRSNGIIGFITLLFSERLESLYTFLSIAALIGNLSKQYSNEKEAYLSRVPKFYVKVNEAREAAPYIEISIDNISGFPFSNLACESSPSPKSLQENKNAKFLLNVPRAKNDNPPFERREDVCQPEGELINGLYPKELHVVITDAKGTIWNFKCPGEITDAGVSYPMREYRYSIER